MWSRLMLSRNTDHFAFIRAWCLATRLDLSAYQAERQTSISANHAASISRIPQTNRNEPSPRLLESNHTRADCGEWERSSRKAFSVDMKSAMAQSSTAAQRALSEVTRVNISQVRFSRFADCPATRQKNLDSACTRRGTVEPAPIWLASIPPQPSHRRTKQGSSTSIRPP